MNDQQKRVSIVLKRMQKMAESSEDDAEVFSYELEVLLNYLHGDDFFGTEGQRDPRGDFRNGEWSMDRIEL